MFLGGFAMYSWSLIDWFRCLLLIRSSQNVDLTPLPVYERIEPLGREGPSVSFSNFN